MDAQSFRELRCQVGAFRVEAARERLDVREARAVLEVEERPSRPVDGLIVNRSWWYQTVMSGRSWSIRLITANVSGSLAGPGPAY